VVEVLEKTLSFWDNPEVEKVMHTMQKRIIKPHPNLLRIYSLEYHEESQLCNSYQMVKVYTEYLQKTLKSELNRRRRNGSYLSE
jgi:hypothetical protein